MSAPGFDPTLDGDRARIRLALGDTKAPFDLADETIDALVAIAASADPTAANPPLAAAIAGARALAVKYLKLAQSTTQGEVTKRYADRAKGYRDLAASLAVEGLPGDPEPPASSVVVTGGGVVALPGSDREAGAHLLRFGP